MPGSRRWGGWWLQAGLAIAFLAGMAWVYAGFFAVDPNRSRQAAMLMWAVRLGLPPLTLAGLLLGRAVARGRVRVAFVMLSGLALAVGAGILWSVVCCVHGSRVSRRDLGQYHPYLQLSPRAWTPRPPADGPTPLRIFCLGGSTTEFTDEAGRGWPVRLEERLKGVGDRPIEAYNMGRQWYTSLHTLLNYEVNLRQHKPDVILVMHAINDLLQNADFSTFSTGAFREDYGHFLGPVARIVRQESFAGRLRRELRSVWRYHPPMVVDVDVFPGLTTFRRCLRTLIELARADGTRVVLMTQPYLFKEDQTPAERDLILMLRWEAIGRGRQWNEATALRGMRAYNQAVRALAAEEHLELIDLESAIPKTVEFFSDEVHYREETFDLIADYVAGQITLEPLAKE